MGKAVQQSRVNCETKRNDLDPHLFLDPRNSSLVHHLLGAGFDFREFGAVLSVRQYCNGAESFRCDCLLSRLTLYDDHHVSVRHKFHD